jgi:hypothetical protein
MDSNSTIKEEQTNDIQPILYDNNADTENGNNFTFISRFNERNFYDNTSILKYESELAGIESTKQENKNKLIDNNKGDTLNLSKNLIILNQNKKTIDIKIQKDIYNSKEIIIDNERFTIDSLIRRAKKILFDALLKYDNYIISKTYNNNIGYGLKIKKLLRINHSQTKNTNTNFNRELLKTSQGSIFSVDISTRHSNFPLNHNKILIKKLLNEENEEKRKIFNDLFSATFSDCINHCIGKKKFNCLNELEIYYENELIQLEEEENIKDALKNVINNYEEIFENKKPRKTKMKKKDI